MKKVIGIVLLIMLGAFCVSYIYVKPEYSSASGQQSGTQAAMLRDRLLAQANAHGVTVVLDETEISEELMQSYLSEQFHVMMPVSLIRDALGCTVSYPTDASLELRKGSTEIVLGIGSREGTVNQVEFVLEEMVVEDNGIVYVPIEELAQYLHVQASYELAENCLVMTSIPYEEALPAQYDMRKEGRVTQVRNQGLNANCWAYANLGAAESTLMPEEELAFSANYLSKHSGFTIPDGTGGDYLMAVAYMARWDGPVERRTNTGGTDDGSIVVEGRKVLKHLEEAVFPSQKDYDTIKECVYRYGGVVTSLFINLELENADGRSDYFNSATNAYYFDGNEETNHAVVIVGWDDTYSRDNFSVKPKADGAFICKNSWGSRFGEDGYFYVSYYDANIALYNCCYTRLAEVDNYDYNYQADSLGWIGELGYDCGNAYMANVYTAHEKELLRAAAFYTTDKNTSYKVYVVTDYADTGSLSDRTLVAEGCFAQSGYYTVEFEDEILLSAGERFAVVVYLDTPDSVHPVVIEYDGNDRTKTFDISDGEGYVSLYGEVWTSVEQKQNANLCLKAFTDKAENP